MSTQLTPPSTAARMARTESPSSCGPQLTHHSPGREPIGAVPMPTREIIRSLGPSRRRSMTVGNAVRLARMPLLRAEEETKVREWFAELERSVELVVGLGPEETPGVGARDVDFGAEMVSVCEALAELGDSVSCRVEEEPEGFPRFPAVSIRPDGRDAGVRYDGLPWGYELGSLVGGIVEAGREEPTLRPDSLAALQALERNLALDVFVTPT